jgi:hypothetical protein
VNFPAKKQWRHNILARDNHQCQWPGCRRKTTRVRKLAPMLTAADYSRTDNGISICPQCAVRFGLHDRKVFDDELRRILQRKLAPNAFLRFLVERAHDSGVYRST